MLLRSYDSRAPARVSLVAAAILAAGASVAGAVSLGHARTRSSPTARPRDARVVGNFEVCGGPAPGHCWPQKGFVKVVNSSHHVVAHQRTKASGHFAFQLRPGRYTLAARNTSGARWRQSVKAVAHQTTKANIVIPVP